MERQPASWVALISFCAVMVITTALGFGALFAGGSVAVAVAQSSHGSEQRHADTPTQLLPRSSDNKQARAVASQQLKETEENETGPSKTFAGMITDSRCSARHPMDSGKTPAECARLCVRNGSRYVLVNGERNHSLQDDTGQIEKVAGERVRVVGLLEGDTIKVKSIASR